MTREVFVVFGLVFLFGAVVGSFLNVCIYRIPARKSLVWSRSHCPACDGLIPWYYNLPVLSYLLLRGHCASCKAPISPRYPLVEILTGVLFVMSVRWFGLQPFVIAIWVFLAVLVVITFIDLDHQIIPDVISLPGILLAFLGSFFIPWVSPWESLLGILAGGGSLFVIAWGYELLSKKEGMGGGDIKLLAMIGAFLGWKSILPIVLFASLAGTAIGVPLMLMRRKGMQYALPFGPFLACGAVVYIFWGGTIIRWYFSLFLPQ